MPTIRLVIRAESRSSAMIGVYGASSPKSSCPDSRPSCTSVALLTGMTSTVMPSGAKRDQ
jgi:hypothetical protein